MAFRIGYYVAAAGNTPAGTAASNSNDGKDALGLAFTAGAITVNADGSVTIAQTGVPTTLLASVNGLPTPLNIPLYVTAWSTGSGGTAGRVLIKSCTADSVTVTAYTEADEDAATLPTSAGSSAGTTTSTGPWLDPHKFFGTTVSPTFTPIADPSTAGTSVSSAPQHSALTLCGSATSVSNSTEALSNVYVQTRGFVFDGAIPSANATASTNRLGSPISGYAGDKFGRRLDWKTGAGVTIHPISFNEYSGSDGTWAGTDGLMKIRGNGGNTLFLRFYGWHFDLTYYDVNEGGNGPTMGVFIDSANGTSYVQCAFVGCRVYDTNCLVSAVAGSAGIHGFYALAATANTQMHIFDSCYCGPRPDFIEFRDTVVGMSGITAASCILVTNCLFFGCVGYAVKISGTTSGFVMNCTAVNCGYAGSSGAFMNSVTGGPGVAVCNCTAVAKSDPNYYGGTGGFTVGIGSVIRCSSVGMNSGDGDGFTFNSGGGTARSNSGFSHLLHSYNRATGATNLTTPTNKWPAQSGDFAASEDPMFRSPIPYGSYDVFSGDYSVNAGSPLAALGVGVIGSGGKSSNQSVIVRKIVKKMQA